MGALKVWMVCSFFLLTVLHQNCQTYSKVFEPQNLMEFDCPTWHIYNQESGKCECYQFNDEDDIIKCRDNGMTMLQYG